MPPCNDLLFTFRKPACFSQLPVPCPPLTHRVSVEAVLVLESHSSRGHKMVAWWSHETHSRFCLVLSVYGFGLKATRLGKRSPGSPQSLASHVSEPRAHIGCVAKSPPCLHVFSCHLGPLFCLSVCENHLGKGPHRTRGLPAPPSQTPGQVRRSSPANRARLSQEGVGQSRRRKAHGQKDNQIGSLLSYGECMEHNTNMYDTRVHTLNSKLKKYKLKNRNI